MALVFIMYKIFFIRNKEDAKKSIKSIKTRIIATLIPVFIMIIYLSLSGAFSEFISYAILGIKTFSNKISYLELIHSEQLEIKIVATLISYFYNY